MGEIPDPGLNPGLWQGKRYVLTTGPPGDSRTFIFELIFYLNLSIDDNFQE